MKLDPERAALIVVDVQEGFRKAIPGFDRIAVAAATMLRGADAIGIPAIVTEQYPKGLGHTVDEVAGAVAEGNSPLEKLEFAASCADGFDLGGRDQVLVCGIETHVCVNQTVLDLLSKGVDAHVISDAVGSRFAESRQIGLDRMEREGAVLTNVEASLFELLGRAGTDEFKTVQKLILEFAPTPAATASPASGTVA